MFMIKGRFWQLKVVFSIIRRSNVDNKCIVMRVKDI